MENLGKGLGYEIIRGQRVGHPLPVQNEQKLSVGPLFNRSSFIWIMQMTWGCSIRSHLACDHFEKSRGFPGNGGINLSEPVASCSFSPRGMLLRHGTLIDYPYYPFSISVDYVLVSRRDNLEQQFYRSLFEKVLIPPRAILPPFRPSAKRASSSTTTSSVPSASPSSPPPFTDCAEKLKSSSWPSP